MIKYLKNYLFNYISVIYHWDRRTIESCRDRIIINWTQTVMGEKSIHNKISIMGNEIFTFAFEPEAAGDVAAAC